MPKSTNLGLELTTSDQTNFRAYRESLNGVGEGDAKSNAQIIDEFAGKFSGGADNQYLKRTGEGNFNLAWETPDTEPADNSEKLLTSGGAFDAIEAAKGAVDTGKRVIVTTDGAVSTTIQPDKFYSFTGSLTSLIILLAEAVDGRENEFKGQFLTGSSAPTVSFPETVAWVGGMPEIEANKKYQFSILDNIGVIVGM